MRRLLFLTGILLASSAAAQIGDVQDKPGEVQELQVPPERIPAAPALTPAEAMKTFTVAPGYRLELAAADPLVQEPVAIAFSPDGRMWVAEMRGYMPDLDGTGEDAPVGRIVVLTDRDGDGVYDESKVFVDGLVLPRALLPVGDGLLVGAPPELTFWRDTDGDGRADQKTIVASDYGVMTDPKRPHLANPERAPNSLVMGYDNWIYSAAYVKKFRYVNGQWETKATDFRGQWGLTQDDYGRFYHGSNEDHLRVDVIFADYLRRNPNFPRLEGFNVDGATDQLVWPGRVNPGVNRGYRPGILRDGRLRAFTTACAFFVYRGDLLPELNGNFFVGEPGANLVRREILTSTNGAIRGRNAYADEQKEFITSTDERFRPVNFATGPDGALYIVDLYRGVLQHRISLTSYLRKQYASRNLDQGQHLGRIYRVMPANRQGPVARPGIPASTAQWIELLSHPNIFWRQAAQQALVLQRDAATVPALRTLATSGKSALGRVHALWTLEGIDALDQPTVMAGLIDSDPIVRTMAARFSERFLGGKDRATVLERLLALASDPQPEVRLQAVLSLGEAKSPDTDRALANLVRRNPDQPYLADAFFSGIGNRELLLLEDLIADRDWAPGDPKANAILGRLAQGILTSRDAEAITRLVAIASSQPPPNQARVAALLDGMVAAAPFVRRPIEYNLPPPGWNGLARHPSFRPKFAKLDPLVIWKDKPGAATAKPAALTKEEQARFDAGKTLFTGICATCHQITGRGLDGLAPPLLDSEWVLGSPERVIRIVLHGLKGPIVVLGREHTGDMPAFKAMEDEQLASILTYIRREWGHGASPISPDAVKTVRAATASQTDSVSARELVLQVP
jgi:mono/diheme cytochrome c family protein/glucose/arabinose dehydrogenase